MSSLWRSTNAPINCGRFVVNEQGMCTQQDMPRGKESNAALGDLLILHLHYSQHDAVGTRQINERKGSSDGCVYSPWTWTWHGSTSTEASVEGKGTSLDKIALIRIKPLMSTTFVLSALQFIFMRAASLSLLPPQLTQVASIFALRASASFRIRLKQIT